MLSPWSTLQHNEGIATVTQADSRHRETPSIAPWHLGVDASSSAQLVKFRLCTPENHSTLLFCRILESDG